MSSVIYKVYGVIFKRWRAKRFDHFLTRLKVSRGDTLLDVGGFWWNWTESVQIPDRIVCLNPDLAEFPKERFPHHNIDQVQGDGCHIQASDQEYEIAYSNSVIEHVGDFSKQVAFAAELRRVGKRIWVQTPAKECPFEPHYLAPFVHWLPGKIAGFVMRYLTPRSLIEGPNSKEIDLLIASTRLISRREMDSLFPDCEILTERFLWIFPKSYIAVRHEPTPAAARHNRGDILGDF